MNKQKVPKLRFPGFTGEWVEKKLLELGENGFSNGVFNDPKMVGSGYKLINVKEMYEGDVINYKNLTLVDIPKTEFQKNKVLKGDIFFTRSSLVKDGIAFSNIFIDDFEDVTYDGHLIRMRPKKNLLVSKYFSYQLKTQTVRRQLVVRGKTTTMTTIGQDDIGTVQAFLPTLHEQQKIADFLTDIDTKIEKLTRKKELMTEYKKGVMQKIFSQKIRFKDEKGKDYPDWEEKRLGDVCDVRDGTHESPKYHEQGYPLITSKNLLANGDIDLENISLISEEDYISINKRSGVSIGDILFGMIGTIGNPVMLKSVGFAIKNVALIKEKKELLNQYLIQFLNSAEITKQFYEQNTGGTQKFLALGIIRQLTIASPTIKEQKKIAEFLTNLDKKIEHIELELKAVKEFKKGLLQKMFV